MVLFTKDGIGLKDKKRIALVIEPQDDFLIRDILKKNEMYKRYIIYEFKSL